MSPNKPEFLVLHPRDNVAVALVEISKGQELEYNQTIALDTIPAGHKIAVNTIASGSAIIKYGQVIGYASRLISQGKHVHVDNVFLKARTQRYYSTKSAIETELIPSASRRTFEGFVRNNGRVGTRNFLGVLATVSCSADVAHFVADAIDRRLLSHFPSVDGVVAITHGSGCCHAPDSEGLDILRRTLSGYANNPNFGGVIIIGLGCETNLVSSLMETTGLQEGDFLSSFTIQSEGGTTATIEAGVAAAEKMLPTLNSHSRKRVSIEHLVVGLECGGSDAYSGITANPALGAAVDLIVKNGGTAVLSETPEIYGAEHLLVERAQSEEVGNRLIDRIKWWEDYTSQHNAQINNNPTPGNKAGGISTILEKSMGAVTKGGSSNLTNVYRYAQTVKGPGLVFMDTPGYDVVSITGMIAGGANIICFTTGRGTVSGFRPVPAMKLATNSLMFNHLEGDMDINCGRILDGECDIDQMGIEIFEEIIATASGKQTKSEVLGFGGSDFVPWQIGAIL